MKLEPLYDKVFVRPVNARESAGGIALPEGVHDRKDYGEVVAAGPGQRLANGDIHPLGGAAGEVVVFPLQHARRVMVEGEELFLIDSRHLLAVVEGA
ncbi:MAG TPA: hypothetical protein VKT32_10625 [Chthonomonadaceae bacterium]|nr:hypothetical protein [Chthonomonadaceae bacterium]